MRDLEPGEFYLDLCRVSVPKEFVFLLCPKLVSSRQGPRRLMKFRAAGAVLTACLQSLDCLVSTGEAGRCLFLSSDARLRRFNSEAARADDRISPTYLRAIVKRLHTEGLIAWRKGNNFHDGKKAWASSFTVTGRFWALAAGFFEERGKTLEEGLCHTIGRPYKSKRPPITFGEGFKERPPRCEWAKMVPLVLSLRRSHLASRVEVRLPQTEWDSPAFPDALAWLEAGGVMPSVSVWGGVGRAFPDAAFTLGEFIEGKRCRAIGLSRLFVTDPATGDRVADITHLFGDLHRAFTERMDETGRFYSSATPLPRILRRFVTVDGVRVVDLDLTACHPTLLFHTLLKRPAPSDLYERPTSLLGIIGDSRTARKAVKLAVVILINARKPKTAEWALAFKLLKPHDDDGFAFHLAIRRELNLAEGQPMTESDARRVAVRVIQAVRQGLPELGPHLFSGKGNRLQRVESSVLERVLPECLARGMWVQPFHDGLLVRESDAREAMTILSECYREVIAFPTIVTAKVYSGDDGLARELEGHSMRLQSGEATLIPQTATPQGILESPTSSRSSSAIGVL